MKLASSSYYYKSKIDVEGQARSDAELRELSQNLPRERTGFEKLRQISDCFDNHEVSDTISVPRRGLTSSVFSSMEEFAKTRSRRVRERGKLSWILIQNRGTKNQGEVK